MVRMPTPDLSLVTNADLEAAQDAADVARLINRESVWLPFALAGGHGLKPAAVLRYVAAFDRADNVTGILKWNSKAISARCGLPASRVPVGTLLNAYKDADLLLDVQATMGRYYQVQFPRPEKTLRLRLGALWTHRWNGTNPVGPRYGDDTPEVLRCLLAIMRAGDWDEHGLTVTTYSAHLGRHLTAREIADRSKLAYSTYRRAWATVKRVCVQDDWIQWEQTYRDDLGADAYKVVLDWRKVPDLIAIPTQNPSDIEQGGPSGSEQRSASDDEQEGPRMLSTLNSETSAFAQCSSFISSSPNPGAAAKTSGTRLRESKRTNNNRVEGMTSTVQLKPSTAAATGIDADLAVAAAGTRPEAAASDRDDHTKTSYDAWLLAVVAGIAASSNPRRLPLSLRDAQGLYEPLRAAYGAGWMPAPIVASLTRQSPDVESVAGALRWRVANLPARVNARVTTASKQDLHDEAVYAAAASSRSADKYTQRTM